MQTNMILIYSNSAIIKIRKTKKLYNSFIHLSRRDALITRRMHDAKDRPKSRRSVVRKSKSEALPKLSQLFTGRVRTSNQQNVRGNVGSKSDLCFQTARDRHLKPANPADILRYAKRSHMLERTIGDSELTSQLNDIVELNEELDTVHKSFTEGGCGDTGFGCPNIEVRMIEQNFAEDDSGEARACAETSDEDYFVDIGEAADQWALTNGTNRLTNGAETGEDHDVDEEGLDETSANSLSGEELLNFLVKKQPAVKFTAGKHSMFTSAYSGQGH